ncbi:MAG: leucine-rich repeat domain-containing protein [Treponema sp.]|nr:leucine-rich repeat domain-containing protein [Treponema sp.]
MKKTLAFVVLALVAALSFAANSEKDFYFKISDDAESIIITGFKNNLKAYDIPAAIEDVPVSAVETEFLGFSDVKEISLSLPEGLKNFSLTQIYSGKPLSHITINGLPSSLERCNIKAAALFKDSQTQFFIKLKGTLDNLPNLKKLVITDVEFEHKVITVKKEWAQRGNYSDGLDYDFCGSNIEEIVFEEGCLFIGGCRGCKNLRKASIPSTATTIGGRGFIFCTSLSELVIPEFLGHINCIDSYMVSADEVFRETALPIKTQVRLRKMGYSGSFGTE